jgi:hypothetical protein
VKKPVTASQQLDFWPPLKTRSMVACARISYVRGGHVAARSGSEDGDMATAHAAVALAPVGAHPDGNHGVDDFRPKAPTLAHLKGHK